MQEPGHPPADLPVLVDVHLGQDDPLGHAPPSQVVRQLPLEHDRRRVGPQVVGVGRDHHGVGVVCPQDGPLARQGVGAEAFDLERAAQGGLRPLFSDPDSTCRRLFHSAAIEFETDAKWQQSPFIYHMPKMHMSMRLALSHSDGKVKGVFRKKTTKSEESVVSTLEIDVVAVPRQSVIAASDTQTADGD